MKTVLITGGSGGIGSGIISDLLADNYRVINLDVVPLESSHNMYSFYQVDISEEVALEQVLNDIPHVDVLINNAVVMDHDAFESQSMSDIRHAITVNVLAPIQLAKWYGNQYNGTSGRIINMSSTRARMSEANTIAYSASKGAMESLTHSLAITLQDKQITVNAIAPGWIHHGADNLREIDHQFHPSKRVGQVRDIVRVVRFLIDENSTFINGEVLTVDGGVTKKMIYPE